MATKTFNTRIANKRDTSANWTSNNPVLLNGEIIIVDTEAGQVRYKVGNGTSTYTQLPFTDESLITNINGKLSLSGGTMTGNINMGGHKLTDLGAPVNSNDAVRQADLKVVSDEVDGIIAGTTAITLPIADDTKLGGVKIGEGVNVAEDGTISVKPELPDGGTEGQMLYKSADGAVWGDKPVMYVNITESVGTYSADKKLSEIKDAYQRGFSIIANTPNGIIPMTSIIKYATFIEFDINHKRTNEYLVGEDRVIYQMTAMSNFASDVSYDRYASGLRATNVQDAIDEVQENVENVLPSGGTTGQVLTKTSTGEEWSDAPSGLPENGTEGQILEKTSSGAAWVDKPESGLTQEQADERYLQLSGGTMTNTLNFSIGSYGFGTMLKATTQNGDVGIVANDKQNVSVMANGLYVQTDGGATENNKVVVQGDLDEIKTTSVAITLTADGWTNTMAPVEPGGETLGHQQTVTVSGVSASETAQLITPTPAIASQSAYYEAGIMCTGQAANSLTFTCQTVPTSNLTVYVVIQPLG